MSEWLRRKLREQEAKAQQEAGRAEGASANPGQHNQFPPPMLIPEGASSAQPAQTGSIGPANAPTQPAIHASAPEPAQNPSQQAAAAGRVQALKQSRSDYDTAYEHDRKARKKFRLRVVYNRKGCIGSSHCILSDPYNFELDETMRAVLKGGEELPNAPGVFVKVIETDEPHLVLNAAKTCTPKVISVIDLDTGKRIGP